MRMYVNAGEFSCVWLTGVRRSVRAVMRHGAISNDLGHQQRLVAPCGLMAG